MRTLLELSDGLVTNAFGTHLGYAAWLDRRLHWLSEQADQDLSALSGPKAEEEAAEWQERQRLSAELADLLQRQDQAGVRQLLDPFWGLDRVQEPARLRQLLVAAGMSRP